MMTATLCALEFDGADGGDRINAALAAAAAAVKAGHRVRVVVSAEGPDTNGEWSLSRPVAVPSDVTLILEDSLLRLSDGANCAMIQNSDPAGGNRNISVVGVGRARLHGNPAGQRRTRRGRDVEIWMEERGLTLSRATREVIGDRSVREFEEQRSVPGDPIAQGMCGSSGMEFTRVERLRIENLEVGPANMWGVHAEACNDVVIERICFAQDGSEPNQDGVGIVGPSQRVRISGITGTCGDDAVGLHAISPGGGGPIVGVTISDVQVRNVWNSALLRTEGTTRAPVRNVVASNLVLLDGEGYSEGHAAIKLGTTRRNWEAEMERDVGDARAHCAQSAISISGLSVEGWVGPVIAVFAPIDDLVISGVTGTHTGPLFVNFESKMRGCCLSNMATRMLAVPEDEPFVGGMLEYSMVENHLPRSIKEDERAAIILDGDGLAGLFLRDVRVVMDDAAQAQAHQRGARTVGLIDRTRNHVAVQSNVVFPGFELASDSSGT